MEISENQNKAAGEIVDLIANTIGRNREVHSATAVSTAARLSGSFLFKSFGLKVDDAEPGSAVLSRQANEEGPEMINLMGAVLENLGATIDNKKMETAGMHESQLDFIKSMAAIQFKANEIMNNYRLNNKEMAIASSMAAAFIIYECRDDLGLESGFNTAIYGLIEGSKTVPPEMGESAAPLKKWYKFW